jgi:hypothetical protein
MTKWCMRIACWIPRARIQTHSEYVILIAFPATIVARKRLYAVLIPTLSDLSLFSPYERTRCWVFSKIAVKHLKCRKTLRPRSKSYLLTNHGAPHSTLYGYNAEIGAINQNYLCNILTYTTLQLVSDFLKAIITQCKIHREKSSHASQ